METLEPVDNPYASLARVGTLRQISPCCRATILSHVLHNPMMVCPDCKTMIKCFLEQKACQNYATFCRSRNRKITSFSEDGIYFVMFNAFVTTSHV